MNSKAHTVAIVEDDELVGLATANLIRSVGLIVRVFRSVDAFLAQTSHEFGCIVSDVQMPGKSGLELLQTLRRQGDAVPVIMMTAYSADAVRQQALDLGAHCFLEKPYDPEFLIECLESVLGSFDD